MPEITVKVEGAAALAASAARAGERAGDMAATNAAVARQILPFALAGAPRRTGRLAGTISASSTRHTAVISAGGHGVKYAGVEHYGWPSHHRRPHPWLTAAIHDSERIWIETYIQGLDDVLNGVTGK